MTMGKEIKCGFDIYNSKESVFNTELKRTIWCLYKSNHITSQYFDEEVELLANELEQHTFKTFEEFESVIKKLQFKYGTNVGASLLSWHGVNTHRNEDFFKELFPYVIGDKKLNIIIEL